ncbi:flagellar hook-length control protein FliK [Bacillus sp. FJAT-42376]|uniref:flagellar hook-length control protein FliK n=1 Tax=Bacillus sp. FJAT-42376 TaxID=2014076 RepID=UPI000F4D6AFD|nr:flagellar hook-length control protein FliK [Bacillus sp. FJAT-42376]AZB42942.1 flagellar hook-length control protein FliK [Bacillus sp. FJAT-42376]
MIRSISQIAFTSESSGPASTSLELAGSAPTSQGERSFLQLFGGLLRLSDQMVANTQPGPAGSNPQNVTEEDLFALLEGLQEQISNMLEKGDVDSDLLSDLQELASGLFSYLAQSSPITLSTGIHQSENSFSLASEENINPEAPPEWMHALRDKKLQSALAVLQNNGQMVPSLKTVLQKLINTENGNANQVIPPFREFQKSVRQTVQPSNGQDLQLEPEPVQQKNSLNPFPSAKNHFKLKTAETQTGTVKFAAPGDVEASPADPPAFTVQSPLSKQEQLSLFIKTDSSGNRASQQDLVFQIQQLFQNGKFTAVNGSEKLFLKLYPEHLGELRIEIMQSDGKWTAKFTAATAFVKEAIENHMHHLKQGLAGQHIQLEKVEVFQSFSSAGRDLMQEQGERHREQSQRERRREEQDLPTFEESLHEELVNEKV